MGGIHRTLNSYYWNFFQYHRQIRSYSEINILTLKNVGPSRKTAESTVSS